MPSRLKNWSYRIFAPRTLFREKYQALQTLLERDAKAHRLMAALQEAMITTTEDICRIRMHLEQFSLEVKEMVRALNSLHPGSYSSLIKYHKKYDFYARFALAAPQFNPAPPYLIDFSNIDDKNKSLCGSKASHIASLSKKLPSSAVAPGFAITCNAYYRLFTGELETKITAKLAEIDLNNPKSLNVISEELRNIVLQTKVPEEIISLIQQKIQMLKGPFAVRSSALGEDGDFSFAGQYQSLLHVPAKQVIDAWLKVIASKYTPSALTYRIRHGLDDSECVMAVFIQQMIMPEISGVLYTGEIFRLNSIKGEGEKLVSGENCAEELLLSPEGIILSGIPNLVTAQTAREITLLGKQIEELYLHPQDIEWAIDTKGKIRILQTRPLHNNPQNKRDSLPETTDILLPVIAKGKGIAAGLGSGKTYHLHNARDINELTLVPANSIVISQTSPPELTSILYRISGLICKQGATTSHLATVARELGVPIVLDKNAFSIKEKTTVTINGNNGEIYDGFTAIPRQVPVPPPRYQEAMKFTTNLTLTNPASRAFKPSGCTSLHDIIRFSHEKGMQAVFDSDSPASSRQALRLASDIPLDIFLFDVGGGVRGRHGKRKVPLKAVQSAPFQSLWKGLTHPSVKWVQKPFDWEAYHKIEMSGAIPPPKDSIVFASYAAIAPDYAHFNLRFGYHFTIVNTRCCENPQNNYCMIRFAGGGSDDRQLALRVHFLAAVLDRLEFDTDRKGSYLEARIEVVSKENLLHILETLGHLLGASKLMDMILKDEAMAAKCVEEFFSGRFDFTDL